MRALTCHVLPELVAGEPRPAAPHLERACATGEEPLTIAMALAEAGWFDRRPIEIHASDASPAALDGRAPAATASARSGRCRLALREKYFASPTARGRRSRAADRGSRRGASSISWTRPVLPHAPARSCSAGTCSSIFRRRASGASSPQFAEAMPTPGLSVRRRVGVALRGSRRFELEESAARSFT